jgi:hypothetical protein
MQVNPTSKACFCALVALGGLALAPMAAHASVDPLIEGARQCTQYFPDEEKKNSIPTCSPPLQPRNLAAITKAWA